MLLDPARDGGKYRSDDPSSKAFNSMYAIDNPAMKPLCIIPMNLLKDLNL
jgi:hypothetical protein